MKIIRQAIKTEDMIFECICFCNTNIVVSDLKQAEKIKNFYYITCPRCKTKYLISMEEDNEDY